MGEKHRIDVLIFLGERRRQPASSNVMRILSENHKGLQTTVQTLVDTSTFVSVRTILNFNTKDISRQVHTVPL